MEQLGQIAYEGYAEEVSWISIKGEPLPPWETLPPTIKSGWIAAGKAVRDQICSGGYHVAVDTDS